MTAPLGVRVCPAIGCRRPLHVTPGGAVWARCVSHALALLHRSFEAPYRATDLAVPPVAGSVVLSASSNRRP